MIPAIAFFLPAVAIVPAGEIKGWVPVGSFPTPLTCSMPAQIIARPSETFSYSVIVADKDEYRMKQNGKWAILEMPNFLTECKIQKLRSGKLVSMVLYSTDTNSGSKSYLVTVRASLKPGVYLDSFRAVDGAIGKLHDRTSEVVSCTVCVAQ